MGFGGVSLTCVCLVKTPRSLFEVLMLQKKESSPNYHVPPNNQPSTFDYEYSQYGTSTHSREPCFFFVFREDHCLGRGIARGGPTEPAWAKATQPRILSFKPGLGYLAHTLCSPKSLIALDPVRAAKGAGRGPCGWQERHRLRRLTAGAVRRLPPH